MSEKSDETWECLPNKMPNLLYSPTLQARNGQVVPVDGRLDAAGAWQQGQAYSESSSYETHEHFERKMQRVKKTRGERERSRSKNKKVSAPNLINGLGS